MILAGKQSHRWRATCGTNWPNWMGMEEVDAGPRREELFAWSIAGNLNPKMQRAASSPLLREKHFRQAQALPAPFEVLRFFIRSSAVRCNPNGIVPSSPGLRARELPWVSEQQISQPQRGCGCTIHLWVQPLRWGCLVIRRWVSDRLTVHGRERGRGGELRIAFLKLYPVVPIPGSGWGNPGYN